LLSATRGIDFFPIFAAITSDRTWMHCPNYPTCQLIHVTGFVESQSIREQYIQNFCTSVQETWKNCKRYLTHSTLHFCPDFVFPDTLLSIGEIMDKFDHEEAQINDLNQ